MTDTRVCGSNGRGVDCDGDLTATRCIFEESGYCGLWIGSDFPTEAAAELVDCVIRKNNGSGVAVNWGKLLMRGGTIRENGWHGVHVYHGGARSPLQRLQRTSYRPSARTIQSTTGA